MAQFGRGLAATMVGASLMALAGCGGGGGNAAGANPPATNTAAQAPAASPAQPHQRSAPDAAQPAAGPTRYCGTIHNATVNQDAQGEIDVNPGAGFSGAIILNGSTLQGGAGPFQGTMSNGQCSGVSSSGGLSFTGACPAGGEYDGSFTISGQQGVFRMSTSACH